ncbi:MAG: DUF1700 domain-containing protein [Clostridia bacterium]|nr:DUF1700 domain-containing protein [Clostridia bacterium]
MTRREYLTALNQYLVTMSESEKTAILKEYDDHFRRGFEAGKTEAQVSASLGTPYDVANEFLAGRHPKAPSYPPKPTSQTVQTRPQAAQPRPQATQPRPQTVQPQQPRPQTYSAPTYPTQQQSYSAPTYPTQQQSYSAPTYPTQQQSYSAPTYPTHQQSYSAPTYPTQQQSYSAPSYTAQTEAQYAPRPQSSSAYVDYDRAAHEEPLPERKNRESKYNTTGIIIVIALGVILIPTLGGAIVGLLITLYSLIVAFPTTGVALIAAGGALSAKSFWVCLGLIFIGISFLALTGLIVMGAIEGTRLFVKLIKYVIKECKKMIREGSF